MSTPEEEIKYWQERIDETDDPFVKAFCLHNQLFWINQIKEII